MVKNTITVENCSTETNTNEVGKEAVDDEFYLVCVVCVCVKFGGQR